MEKTGGPAERGQSINQDMVRLCGNGKPEGGGREKETDGVKDRKTPSPEQTKGKGGVTGSHRWGWGRIQGDGPSWPTAPHPSSQRTSLSAFLQGLRASVLSYGLYLRSDQSHLLPLLPGPWEVRRCLWVVARWEIGG